MTPVTKKPRLAVKMPADMANRRKMPLDVLKSVFNYLSREEQQRLRPVCSFWNRCISTRPSHFQQFLQLDRLYCGWQDLDENLGSDGERWWPDVKSAYSCCGHLEALATELVGKLFIPALAADVEIEVQVKMTTTSRLIYYHFANKLTKETARHALHLCFHLGQAAFDDICDWKAGTFLWGVRPEIASLFLPMRCRHLRLGIEESEPDISSLKSIAAAVKHQEIEWYFGRPPPPEQVKKILEEFAIGARRLYKHLEIFMYCGELSDENEHWTALFKEIIQFFSQRLKESGEMVPRVDFNFCDENEPDWPLVPFSNMEPIDEESVPGDEGVMITKRTFEIKAGSGSGAKTFKSEVHGWGYYEWEGHISRISFLFD